MRRLTTGYVLRNVSLGDFVVVRTLECTYTNLDSIAYYTPSLYVQPIAPRLQTCTACYCIEYYRYL